MGLSKQSELVMDLIKFRGCTHVKDRRLTGWVKLKLPDRTDSYLFVNKRAELRVGPSVNNSLRIRDVVRYLTRVKAQKGLV